MNLQRQRKYISWTHPINKPLIKQVCKNCGCAFYYHEKTDLCDECDWALFGEYEEANNQKARQGDLYERKALDKLRTANIQKGKSQPELGKAQYEIVKDPLAINDGGFRPGARLKGSEIEVMLKMETIAEGTIIRHRHTPDSEKVVIRIGKKLELIRLKDLE